MDVFTKVMPMYDRQGARQDQKENHNFSHNKIANLVSVKFPLHNAIFIVV